jgi:hypothetical protein
MHLAEVKVRSVSVEENDSSMRGYINTIDWAQIYSWILLTLFFISLFCNQDLYGRGKKCLKLFLLIAFFFFGVELRASY